MKIRKNMNRICTFVMVAVFLSSLIIGNNSMRVFAKEESISVAGKQYEFEKGGKYEVDNNSTGEAIIPETSYGAFSIKGDMKSIHDVNGVAAYEVSDSNVVLTYSLIDSYKNADNSEWHLIDDKSKKVNGIELEKDILSGAVIVQTSLSGDSWITDVVYTDICDAESAYTSDIYISKDIQQVNGCFYRVIVAYELSKEEEVGKSFTNWSGTETDYKKCAEVYEFYLINSSENSSGATLSTATPRRELGSKINTGKDNGYSGNVTISNEDPHYGWNLGTFFVNGYTRETTTTDGNPLFLKNVGDRVTLWFNLQEDINCLHGNKNLSICEDKDGYDQYFEIEKTNFKRGTLIISYTDYEGKTHEPVIYTDYLAANTKTGADTKVELFEEGDYEVALNYEIRNTKGWDSYSDYRIFFQFSIRNGNCMVYPFDIVTGAELSDNALTENGFKLDMAKSRYLTINVKKEVLKSNGNGYYTDERFNRPAKDGESYSDEGIYTFSVKNLYTDSEPTTKVIYVGSTPVLNALSSGYQLEEINALLSQGAEIKQDGSIEMKKEEETVSQEIEVEKQDPKVEQSEIPETVVVNNDTEKADSSSVTILPETKKKTNMVICFAVIISIAVVLVGYLILRKKKKVSNDNVETDTEEADR